MQNEAPMIKKALRVVSLIVIMVTIALAAAGAYSVYSEFSALSGLQRSISGGNANFNGSSVTLSNIVIPNNMTFPIVLEILGSVSLAGYVLGSFDSGSQNIPPGGSVNISLSTPLNYTKAFENQAILGAVLFKSELLVVNTSVLASVEPLLSISLVRAANSSVGPILGNFNASLDYNAATFSGQTAYIPLTLSFNNLSPITFTGNLNMVLVRVGNNPAGNYGSATGQLSVVQGANSHTFNFTTPLSNYSTLAPPNTYDFRTNVTLYGSTYSFWENFTQ